MLILFLKDKLAGKWKHGVHTFKLASRIKGSVSKWNEQVQRQAASTEQLQQDETEPDSCKVTKNEYGTIGWQKSRSQTVAYRLFGQLHNTAASGPTDLTHQND